MFALVVRPECWQSETWFVSYPLTCVSRAPSCPQAGYTNEKGQKKPVGQRKATNRKLENGLRFLKKTVPLTSSPGEALKSIGKCLEKRSESKEREEVGTHMVCFSAAVVETRWQ